MNKNIINILKFVFFLSIGLLLLWLASKSLDAEQWQSMKQSLKGVNYTFVALSIIAGILSHLIRALRWQQMINTFGYKPKLYNTFFSVMIGYLANYVFLRMGEVMRCGFLARYDEPPADKLLGSVIAERVVDLIILIALFSITVLTQYQRLSDYFFNNIWSGLSAKFIELFGNGFGIKLLLLFALGCLAFLAYRLLKRYHFVQRLKQFGLGMKDGLLSVKNVNNVPLFIIYTAGIWLMYFLMVLLVFYSLEATSHLGLSAALAVLVFGSFGIIAVQGGIGAYHLIVQQVLLLFAIDAATGLAFGWVSWGVQTLLIIVFGTISFIALPLLNKKSEGGFFSSLQT